MRLLIQILAAAGILSAAAGCSSTKPAEVFDERTGVTVGALEQPIEFVENGSTADLAHGKRTSFAYLGPLEWDTSGDIAYALWVHVAPGSDKQVGDIHARAAVRVNLDDGAVELSPLDAAKVGNSPYRPVVSWGQTGYFQLDLATLKRMASSHKLTLEFHAVDLSTVEFTPTRDTRATLAQYLHARGITGD
jgi:hypothetical protein